MASRNLFLLLLIVLLAAGCSRETYLKPTQGVIEVQQPGDAQMTCAELDNEIGRRYRQAMDMAPEGFMNDHGNAMAGGIGTLAFSPAYLYIIQNEVIDKPRDKERFDALVGRIEHLQRLKARHHCFEY